MTSPMLSLFAALLLIHGAAARAAPAPAPTTYVIQTSYSHPSGVNSMKLKLTLGAGSAATTYWQTVDTGSGLVTMPCNTVNTATKGCKPPSKPSGYNLSLAHMFNASQCATTGSDCYASYPQSAAPEQCIFSYELNGGGELHEYVGVFGSDQVQLPTSNPPLKFSGQFGCYDHYVGCNSTNKTCTSALAACPPIVNDCPATPQCAQGTCGGLQAGSQLVGSGSLPVQVATAMNVTTAMGFCFLVPVSNTQCGAKTAPSSMLIGAMKLPNGLTMASMSSAPLVENASLSSSAAGALITYVNSATIVTDGGNAACGGNCTSSFPKYMYSKWDNGAYGESYVPQSVYNAYRAVFTASYAQYKKNPWAGALNPCTQLEATNLCGSNWEGYPGPPAGPWVCLKIKAPKSLDAANKALLGLYPKSLNISLKNGTAPVSIPTAFIVNQCQGRATKAAAVCSYMTPGNHFWFAGPFFFGRFSFFDGTPKPNAPNGTMYWSGSDVTDCTFPTM